jgi:hypothetical protein
LIVVQFLNCTTTSTYFEALLSLQIPHTPRNLSFNC